jgi:hypothetical protein
MMSIKELRDAKERQAAEYSEAIKKWLTIADLALKAIFDAAEHGNLRCKHALKEILPLLPAPEIAMGSTPTTNDTEQQAVWENWKERLSNQTGEQPVRELRKPGTGKQKTLRAVPHKGKRSKSKK